MPGNLLFPYSTSAFPVSRLPPGRAVSPAASSAGPSVRWATVRPPSRRRTRVGAIVATVLLCLAAAACDDDRPEGAPAAVPTDLDTFTVSHQPTATRANDVVMRVMDSQGKTKVGLVSFVVHVPDTDQLSATLHLHPRQSGFDVVVRDSAPFAASTTHATRPALGAEVGRHPRTTAGTPVAIPLQGVRVRGGRVHLALTTTSPYELEVTSLEGARAAGDPSRAPHLDVSTGGPPPTTPPTTTPPTTAPPRPGWTLTFSDDFDGTAVDTTRWNVYDEDGPWHSVESPKATTCPKASNVSVRDGVLRLRTQRANGACRGGQAHTGAGLNTWGRFTQAQGRFEVRARWTHAGNNLWGGFWTHGNGGPGWDRSQGSEIDVFEYIGRTAEPNLSRFKPAIHFDYECPVPCGMQSVAHAPLDVTQWHTYAVEWEPTDPSDPATTQIRFLLDGALVAQFDRAGAWKVSPDGTRTLVQGGAWTNRNGPFPTPFGPDRPHQLLLSAWVGAPGLDPASVAAGYLPAGGHADLEVDHVRVYRR